MCQQAESVPEPPPSGRGGMTQESMANKISARLWARWYSDPLARERLIRRGSFIMTGNLLRYPSKQYSRRIAAAFSLYATFAFFGEQPTEQRPDPT